jgi:hypothetical protein
MTSLESLDPNKCVLHSTLLHLLPLRFLVSENAGIETRARIFKLLKRPGIDSASLYSLTDRYDNPIPNRLLAPIDC